MSDVEPNLAMKEETADYRVDLLCELQAEQRIVEQGWHPVRLNTSQLASNTDLLAMNGRKRISIQVKSTDGHTQKRSSEWLAFGNAANYLNNGRPIFNSKISPLTADIVVAVYYLNNASRYFVFPVAYIEKLCRFHCDFWFKKPKKNDDQRSAAFPIYLQFSGERKSDSEHYKRISRNVMHYKDAWNLMDEPIDRLHNSEHWNLIL